MLYILLRDLNKTQALFSDNALIIEPQKQKKGLDARPRKAVRIV